MRIRLFTLAGLSLLFTVFSLPASSVHAAAHATTRDQIVSLLHDVAGRYGLPPRLLLAVAEQESGLRQDVISCTGDIGVMQINASTARSLNTLSHTHYNPYVAQDNIALGAIYLKYLYGIFRGDLIKVISAYNAGQGTTQRRGVSNWGYVRAVLSQM